MNDETVKSQPEVDTPSPSWTQIDDYISLPRLGQLQLSPDGRRLVVGVSRLDHTKTTYATSVWEIPQTQQGSARRLTRALEGESVAAFTHDGDLLFTSKRAMPADGSESKVASALWCLPERGEAFVWARRDGGWDSLACAANVDRAVLAARVHRAADSEERDAELRAERDKLKINALLHDGYPIRFWDHDLPSEGTSLFVADSLGEDTARTSAELRLVGPAGAPQLGTDVSVSGDGKLACMTWTEPAPKAERVDSVVAVDLESGEHRFLAQGDLQTDYYNPLVSRDGSTIVCLKGISSSPEHPAEQMLYVIDVASGQGRVVAHDWDVWPEPVALSADGQQIFVLADFDGARPLFEVDVVSGSVRQITTDGSFSNVQLSPDASTIFAIRSAVDDPGRIVRIDVATGAMEDLPSPVEYPTLPGRLERVEATADDGTRIPGYLVLPEGEGPHPLVVWIHGGPIGSWNDWSWRWCPWLMVAQGYAILLPDPALSSGYGQDYLQRGWGRWGSEPYTDILALTDVICARDDIDQTKTAAMGGSFGGYMANWVAGHTDRFRAIVTHASLWNLEAFGPTTDAANYWSKEMTPSMVTANSPHRFADQISTPMLVIHGDKDYRVPIGEGLALWWALASGHEGPADELPHRFLYFGDENHWILKPQHARLWYQTVWAFLAWHVHGEEFKVPELL